MVKLLQHFLRYEASAGIFLIAAAILALLLMNSPAASFYTTLLHPSLLFWINDGLMAVFFFLVGLEIKREMLEGHLSENGKRILPGFATLGGVLFPALIYIALNHNDPVHSKGWAIPTATDIAFALGALTLLGDRIPQSIRVFLMTIAVLDDLMAVLIIAIFYTHSISVGFLGLAAMVGAVLILINRLKVYSPWIYVLLSLLLWGFVLQSGVHPTIAGVFAAFTIPLRSAKGIERRLHPWVAYLILPLFAFANAGIAFDTVPMASLLKPLPLGIMLGLVVGKQMGVFLGTWLPVQLGWGKLPKNVSWTSIYGMSILCGIGFTMSLFISTLAFEDLGTFYHSISTLSILLASGFSALVGYAVLRRSVKS